jgi:hypothetical protein
MDGSILDGGQLYITSVRIEIGPGALERRSNARLESDRVDVVKSEYPGDDLVCGDRVEHGVGLRQSCDGVKNALQRDAMQLDHGLQKFLRNCALGQVA